MRGLLVIGFALLLGACNNDQAANVATSDGDVVSEGLRGNDVTAIDAATNDSANMAADVELIENEGNLVAETNNGAEAETNEAE